MIGTLLARRAVAKAFAAINRKDLDEFMSDWANDGVFVYPGDIPQSGHHKGKENVRSWFVGFFEQFPGLTFDVKGVCAEKSFDMFGDNVLVAYWELALHNRDGRDGINSGATVLTIKGGKVVRAIDYIYDTGDEFRKNWSAI